MTGLTPIYIVWNVAMLQNVNRILFYSVYMCIVDHHHHHYYHQHELYYSSVSWILYGRHTMPWMQLNNYNIHTYELPLYMGV
jgi:hypothetical protein